MTRMTQGGLKTRAEHMPHAHAWSFTLSHIGKDTTLHVRFGEEQLHHTECLGSKLRLEASSSVIRLAGPRLAEAKGSSRIRPHSQVNLYDKCTAVRQCGPFRHSWPATYDFHCERKGAPGSECFYLLQPGRFHDFGQPRETLAQPGESLLPLFKSPRNFLQHLSLLEVDLKAPDDGVLRVASSWI
jgi:hypothetical protein